MRTEHLSEDPAAANRTGEGGVGVGERTVVLGTEEEEETMDFGSMNPSGLQENHDSGHRFLLTQRYCELDIWACFVEAAWCQPEKLRASSDRPAQLTTPLVQDVRGA
jgi:hypothetical protein